MAILKGVWAKDAVDTPVSPVQGELYRKTDLTQEETEAAWPFYTIVSSAKTNELLRQISLLLQTGQYKLSAYEGDLDTLKTDAEAANSFITIDQPIEIDIDYNFTVPVVVFPNSVISDTGGSDNVTLTFEKDFIAGCYQCFENVNVIFNGKANPVFEWCGAVCDRTTDSISAINTLLSFLDNSRIKFVIPQYGLGYYVTNVINLPSGVAIIGEAPTKIIEYSETFLEADFTQIDSVTWDVTDASTRFDGLIDYLTDGHSVNIADSGFSLPNGSYEVSTLTSDTIRFYNTSLSSEEEIETPVGASATFSFSVATVGCIFTNKQIGWDGAATENVDLLNADNVDYCTLENLAFIGPGVNAVDGGTVRFTRTVKNACVGRGFVNLYFAHIAGTYALKVEGGVRDYVNGIRAQYCAGYGLVFTRSSSGSGVTTDLIAESIYTNNIKLIGLMFRSVYYSTIYSVVAEGSSIGVLFRDCKQVKGDVNQETIKAKRLEGNGYGVMQINCTAMNINSYQHLNTEIDTGFLKAPLVVVNESSKYTAGQMSELYFHHSDKQLVNTCHTISGTTVTLGVDTSLLDDFSGDFADDPYYIKEGRMLRLCSGNIKGTNYETQGDAFRIDDVYQFDFPDPPDHTDTVDPTVNDDSGDGYAIWSTWLNSVSGDEFVCIDPSVGVAVWMDAANLWQIEYDTRGGVAGDPTGLNVFKQGRLWGADVLAQYPVCWVRETRVAAASSKLRMRISPYDILPTGFEIEASNGAAGSVKEITSETVSLVEYFKVKVRGQVGLPVYYDSYNETPAATIERITVNIVGISYQVQATLLARGVTPPNDERDLWYYILPENLLPIPVSNEWTLTNANLSEMNGTYTNTSRTVGTFEDGSICLEILTGDSSLTGPITVATDYGLLPWLRTVNNTADFEVNGKNLINVLDPDDTIFVKDAFRNIRVGTVDPVATDGMNGDIYIKYIP